MAPGRANPDPARKRCAWCTKLCFHPNPDSRLWPFILHLLYAGPNPAPKQKQERNVSKADPPCCSNPAPGSSSYVVQVSFAFFVFYVFLGVLLYFKEFGVSVNVFFVFSRLVFLFLRCLTFLTLLTFFVCFCASGFFVFKYVFRARRFLVGRPAGGSASAVHGVKKTPPVPKKTDMYARTGKECEK